MIEVPVTKEQQTHIIQCRSERQSPMVIDINEPDKVKSDAARLPQ